MAGDGYVRSLNVKSPACTQFPPTTEFPDDWMRGRSIL